MRLTLIGHASLLIETTDCSILMDPVLWDPHQEGLFHVHPPREVLHAQLPAIDVLVISHRHMDHFDIRSLAHLPRDVQVLIPRDTLLESALRTLGFQRILCLDPLTEVVLGATRLLTTPSKAAVVEFGLVVQDETGSCFNAVDTVMDASITTAIREATSGIDVMVAPWQPMMEVNFPWNRSISFPFQHYAELLGHVEALSPRAVVPGANGFRYCGASSWLNQVVFPVTPERFCKDVRRAGAQPRETFSLSPGDVLEFGRGLLEFRPGHAPFVRRSPADDQVLRFRPVDFDGRLRDAPCPPHEAASLRACVERVLDVDVPRFLEQSDEPWRAHRQLQAVLQFEVVCQDERLGWFIDFAAPSLRVERGWHPLATLYSLISASELRHVSSGTGTWDHAIMGGFYRRFQIIESTPPLTDPLRLMFPSRALQEKVVAAELIHWSHAQPLSPARPRSNHLLQPRRLPSAEQS